jgi:hypothetical protein
MTSPENKVSRLTSIGTLIGQFAVVASLIYVGYEIRLSTRVARAQAHQDLVSIIMSVSDPIVNKIDDVAVLRARADSGFSRLSATERQQFISYSNRLMNLFELAFDQREDGLLGDDVWGGFSSSLERQFLRPGFVEYWEYDRAVFGPRFAAFVDSARSRSLGR